MRDLNEWLRERFPEVSAYDFYRGIFPAGELDEADAFTKGKYTGIILESTEEKWANGKTKRKRYNLTDELDGVRRATETDNFCVCAPLSYAGKRNLSKNARKLYAIAIDVDYIKWIEKDGREIPTGMEDLWHEVDNEEHKHLPRPTYIVSSGNGIHLYYVLEKPVSLYNRGVRDELDECKRRLTEKVWNRYIVDLKKAEKIQSHSIYQTYRMPGTVTKAGGRVIAYLTGERVTLEYLESFVGGGGKKAIGEKHGRVTLEEAAERWHEWYERRIIQKQPRRKVIFNRRLYDWWLKMIQEEATVGHRYYCLMNLAIFAYKCSFKDEKKNPNPVTREELERDCWALKDYLNGLSKDDPFTNEDVKDALKAFDEKYSNYSRRKTEITSGISVPPQKRNHRPQKKHLERARAVQTIDDPDGNWRRLGEKGRKSKADVVAAWRESHPDGKKADCIRDTGLTKPTVYKHWDA